MIATTTTTGQKLQVSGYPGWMELDLGGVTRTFSDEEFLDFCSRHPDARIERESDGEIIIMAPAFTETGGKNASLSYFVISWARKDGTGRAFENRRPVSRFLTELCAHPTRVGSAISVGMPFLIKRKLDFPESRRTLSSSSGRQVTGSQRSAPKCRNISRTARYSAGSSTRSTEKFISTGQSARLKF